MLRRRLMKSGGIPEGAINGVFSVSATKKVYFSKGNLQYLASNNTWRFAENLYDYVGDNSKGNVYVGTTKSNNRSVSETYTGWIDLFGWGTSGYQFASGYDTAYQPWATTTSDISYGPSDGTSGLTGDYANGDWGVYNVISNGGNKAGLWRTLTKDEWAYLFGMEKDGIDKSGHARYRKYFLATVNDMKGIVILPDDITGISDIPAESNRGTASTFQGKTYTIDAFTALLAKGCVFLPAAGYRYGYYIDYIGTRGQYWSSTAESLRYSYYMVFYSGTISFSPSNNKSVGLSVRLVYDIK